VHKDEVKRVIEALLFVHQHPLTVDNIARIVGDDAEKKVIREALVELVAEYERMGKSFHLMEVGEGYQFRTKAEYAPWIRNLRKVKPTRLSQSALETLAIVAYRQPIVRAEVEHIRGVDSGWVLNSLLEKGLIKILGRKEVAGRPLVYGTSRRFLEVFGLRDLSGLPTLQELDALKGEEEVVTEVGEREEG
jgi:segregation and condensation protein B